jgi:hypothetical protein
MQAHVVMHLITNIQDENDRVVLETLGALRNVLVSAGQDACAEAMEQNAVELLLELLRRFVEAIEQGGQRDDEQPDLFLMLEQAIACLWSLSEYSALALKQVTTREMIAFLMKLFAGSDINLSLRRITGQFLNTITDENNDIFPYFLNNLEYSKILLTVLQDANLQTWENCNIELAITSASILNNLKAIFDEKDKLELYKSILSITSEPLGYDIASVLEAVEEAGRKADQSAKAVTPNELTLTMGDLELMAPKNKSTEYLSFINSQLRVLQLVFELLTNMYSEDTPEWDDMEGEDGVDDSQEFFDENMGQDSEYMKPFASLLFQEPYSVFQKVAKFCNLPLVQMKPDGCREFIIQLQQVQIRALAFVSNLFLLRLVDPMEQELKLFWNSIFETLVNTTKIEPIPLELFEGLVSILFSISKMVQPATIAIVISFDIDYHERASSIFVRSWISTAMCF